MDLVCGGFWEMWGNKLSGGLSAQRRIEGRIVGRVLGTRKHRSVW